MDFSLDEQSIFHKRYECIDKPRPPSITRLLLVTHLLAGANK